MFKDFLIIDDIFDDPFAIIEKSKQLEYYVSSDCTHKMKDYKHLNLRKNDKTSSDFLAGSWRGFRTHLLHRVDQDLFLRIMNRIFNRSLNMSTIRYEYSAQLQFYIIPNGLEFEYNWMHTDDAFFAGVVYLNKEYEKNAGTILEINGERQIVENKFNRLLLYKGDVKHAPQNSFFGDIEDRLVLTFFIQKLLINFID